MRTTLDLLLYDWLDASALCARPRYIEHSRETFDAILNAAERLAATCFAPFNRQADVEEPRLDGERIMLPASTRTALQAYADSGLLAAGHEQNCGGLQLPYLIDLAANAFFSRASIGVSAYAMLTYANANLLMAHGTPAQQRAFAIPQMSGRCFGTMCLSEPQVGSSLADVSTRAVADGDDYEQDALGPRYRLKGTKMWISGGEHELTDNIVHLVLARGVDELVESAPGVKGLSLFIVPRQLVGCDGLPTGERNDVTVVGLNHKLGYRGIVNTLLNFGEGRHPVRPPGIDGHGAGAIGYRMGRAGQGLALMFHMMNEARLNVGMGAAMLGQAGYEAALEYARQRYQGRALGPTGKDGGGAPVPLLAHTDVRRMLLAQKSYCTGALALCLYGARLVDEKRTGAPDSAAEASQLLELLTPVAKSWPSQWCLEANSLAIQVHGGYGYTRDFPVEQYWRDNRLNMIHEGTHGIQGLDLLSRKILGDRGRALGLWINCVETTLRAARPLPALAGQVDAMADMLALLKNAVSLLLDEPDQRRALANATPFLEAFGHLVLAWIWLDVAVCAARLLENPARSDSDHLRGLLQTSRYFFRHELPKVSAWLSVAADLDTTCLDMKEAWF